MLLLFDQLMQWIREWGDARNLTAPENLTGQTLKLMSEYGELAFALDQNDSSETRDAFGDCMVVAVMLGAHIGVTFTENVIFNPDQAETRNCDMGGPMIALGKFADAVGKKQPAIQQEQLIQFVRDLADFAAWCGYHFADCVEQSYLEIKDRKGVMFNGVFIKEADPRYEGARRELGLTD